MVIIVALVLLSCGMLSLIYVRRQRPDNERPQPRYLASQYQQVPTQPPRKQAPVPHAGNAQTPTLLDLTVGGAARRNMTRRVNGQ